MWSQIQSFSGLDGTSTCLWSRWLVLRAVGVVYLFVFFGLIRESLALAGPQGLLPAADFLTDLARNSPGPIRAFLSAPSLFWLSASAGMMTFVAWLGLAAAAALVLNLWPRMALFLCWLGFLSFASTWRAFSPAQLDNLMIETALLCIPFAPAGLRPKLGVHSPPRPIAVFMVRWLLFRIMFEAGMVKLTAGDPHWRDLTAMEVMYETSPFPTFFGYIDHHLPHAWHLVEIALTFLAELAAPLLALLGGRRGRWIAFWSWTIFQAGIQLTSNFGWLNTASIGLGFLLLDDQMLASAAARLRLQRIGSFLQRTAVPVPLGPLSLWRRDGLRIALWAHFCLGLFFFAKACGLPPESVPPALAAPVNAFAPFRSVNGYYLYANFDPVRYQVEFEGSNDGGLTWRSYPYRFLPQDPEKICPFIAPRFARFEATLEISAWRGQKSPLYPLVAGHLLAGDERVAALFASNPFSRHNPPTLLRMQGYRFSFTDLDTYRSTGRFWRKEWLGDYLPMLYVAPDGSIQQFDLTAADEAARSGRISEALRTYEEQYALGNPDAGSRLATIYAQGFGVAPSPRRAFEIYSDLVRKHANGARHNLGICYEYGIGTAIDYERAAQLYREESENGNPLSLYSLTGLHVRHRLAASDDVEALTLLLEATHIAIGNPMLAFVRNDEAGYRTVLTKRMAPPQIRLAELRASLRISRREWLGAPTRGS